MVERLGCPQPVHSPGDTQAAVCEELRVVRKIRAIGK